MKEKDTQERQVPERQAKRGGCGELCEQGSLG